PARVVQLIADLDNQRFAVREQANQELENLGEAAAHVIRKKLQGQPSPEVRRRLEALLAKQDQLPFPPDRLRAVRAIEVLEHIGTPEAQEVLKNPSQGAPEARLTQEPKAALARLARRSAAKP